MKTIKQPYVSVSLQLTFKNYPPEYRGLTQEHWSIGKDRPVSLGSLLWSLIDKTARFYCMAMQPVDVPAINKEIEATWRHLAD